MGDFVLGMKTFIKLAKWAFFLSSLAREIFSGWKLRSTEREEIFGVFAWLPSVNYIVEAHKKIIYNKF